AGQSRNVREPLLREVHRLHGMLDPLADDVELALEVRRVARLAAADEDLLDARLDIDGARAEQSVIRGHLSPAQQALPLLGHDGAAQRADLFALTTVARKKHAANAVVLRAGQGNPEAAARLAKELVRHLQQNSRTVARVRFAAARAAVQEIDEDEQPLADDRVR